MQNYTNKYNKTPASYLLIVVLSVSNVLLNKAGMFSTPPHKLNNKVVDILKLIYVDFKSAFVIILHKCSTNSKKSKKSMKNVKKSNKSPGVYPIVITPGWHERYGLIALPYSDIPRNIKIESRFKSAFMIVSEQRFKVR